MLTDDGGGSDVINCICPKNVEFSLLFLISLLFEKSLNVFDASIQTAFVSKDIIGESYNWHQYNCSQQMLTDDGGGSNIINCICPENFEISLLLCLIHLCQKNSTIAISSCSQMMTEAAT